MCLRRWPYLLTLTFVLFTPAWTEAQIQLDPVVSNLASPVFVGNAGDGLNRLFIVEQAGVIKVLQPGASVPSVFLDLQAKTDRNGEQGLLGLAFHPQYATNGRLFVFYTRPGDGTLVIAEYVASPATANAAGTTERILLTIPHPTHTNHNGGMLAFGPDGYLYIGVGDGGSGNDPSNNAQNKDTLLGKILRLDVDTGTPYASPPDNPFVGAGDGRDEIFAYGLRNPWRFSFDRVTGQAWVGDVGQGLREEVNNPLLNGGNYGWRVFEGSVCTNIDVNGCATPSLYVFPVFDYSHSGGRCSLTGGYVYRGFQNVVASGTYLYGDYCSGEIFGWNGSTQSVLLDTTQRISSFGEDEQGEVYVVDLNGTVSRITSAAPCTYSVSPTRATIGAAGGTGSITISTGPSCPWSAASNVSWISVSPPSGSGPAIVTYSVATYTGKPKKRNGTLLIAGISVTIQQSR